VKPLYFLILWKECEELVTTYRLSIINFDYFCEMIAIV
jgi:hypothetical protein